MNQVAVKAIPVIYFLLALSSILALGCNFQHPDSNADKVTILVKTPLAQPTVYEEKIKIIVTGQVVDAQNRPVPNVTVMASLGMERDGKIVKTDASGSFIADAGSNFWTKGNPRVEARAEGFAEKVVYFDRWDTGTRQFEQTLILEPEKKGNNENVSQPAKLN